MRTAHKKNIIAEKCLVYLIAMLVNVLRPSFVLLITCSNKFKTTTYP